MSIIRNILIALLLTGGAAAAAEKRYVVDHTGIITIEKLEILNDHARRISEKHQINVAFFLTDNSFDGKMTLNDYAEQCFDKFIGAENDGFMMAWNRKTLRWAVVERGKGKDIFPKAAKTSFIEAYDSGKTHYDAVWAYLYLVDTYLGKVERGEINFSFWEKVKRSDKSAVMFIGIATVAFILIVFSFQFCLRRGLYRSVFRKNSFQLSVFRNQKIKISV